jgi:solute:Na+ symporter, SSS family
VTTPLWILAVTLVGTVLLALSGRLHGGAQRLEDWSAGGRSFGTLIVFLLLAGEIYTTFTFLGGSGWAYGRGAPSYFLIAYNGVAYVLAYWLLPPIWRRGKQFGLLSQAEYFSTTYGSRALGHVVTVVGLAAMVPYLVLQLKGLGIIVSEASNGSITPTAAVCISTIVTVSYVIATGVHGSARVAALKDVMVLLCVFALAWWLPRIAAGGIEPMFRRLAAEHPHHLLFPDRGYSGVWFVSTVLLTGCGFYMWPHFFASVFTARDEATIRRNTALMPIYSIILLFVILIGYAALLIVPGLQGADFDLALLRAVKASLPPWVVGLVGGAGLLTALVPGSLLLMASSTMLARMIHSVRGTSTDSATLAKWCVPVVAGVALWATLAGGATVVTLLLMAYSVVTQLFPAMVGTLRTRPWVTSTGAFAGIVVGELLVCWLTFSKATVAGTFPWLPAPLHDLNVGIIALTANAIVMLVVSAMTQRVRAPALLPN